jgi:rubrerythrin
MNTEMLLKEFREILASEERAKHFYDHYIDQLDDEEIRNKLISIRDDEIRHIKIAQKLIEHVS